MSIQTDENRVSIVKTILAGTALVVSIGLGIVGEDALIADNMLGGKYLTDNEYKQIKKELIAIVRDKSKSANFNTYQESLLWAELVNTELPCLKKVINVDETNLVDRINDLLESGCP